MLTLQEKRSLLKKEFAEFSSRHDHPVTREELFSYLDFKVSYLLKYISVKMSSTEPLQFNYLIMFQKMKIIYSRLRILFRPSLMLRRFLRARSITVEFTLKITTVN